MEDKATKFRQAFQEFLNKQDLTSDDYMNMFVAAAQSVRQGSGLLWSTMKDIIDEEYLKHKFDLK